MAPTTKNSWCFAWLEGPVLSPGADKAGLLRAAQWETGSAIPMSFLDGDNTLQKRVMKIAREWVGPNMANLELAFQKTGGIVRISFKHRGAWSAIGKSCLQIKDAKRPTMNLGVAGKTPEEFRRTVLHEFGHALGLVHEHATPAGGIKWNRERVKEALQGPPHFWSVPKINENVFRAFAKKETNFTVFDPHSIMLYPFPKVWTKNGVSSRLNLTLSALDKSAIRDWYPHE